MKAKFNTMQIVGAVAGGMIPSVLNKYILPTDMEASTKAIVSGVIGAGLSAFTQGSLLQGASAGMLGVAGQMLADNVIFSNTSGVGLLPGQNAILGIGSPYLPRLTKGASAWSQSKMQEREIKPANVI